MQSTDEASRQAASRRDCFHICICYAHWPQCAHNGAPYLITCTPLCTFVGWQYVGGSQAAAMFLYTKLRRVNHATPTHLVHEETDSLLDAFASHINVIAHVDLGELAVLVISPQHRHSLCYSLTSLATTHSTPNHCIGAPEMPSAIAICIHRTCTCTCTHTHMHIHKKILALLRARQEIIIKMTDLCKHAEKLTCV